jgi:IS5 family transposase
LDGVTLELKDNKLKLTPHLQTHLQLLEKAVADREDGVIDRLVSPVDPDARSGKKEHKHWAGYKGHMIIEEESEIITAIETTPGNKEDGRQLKPLLDQQQESIALKPENLSGDKAYGTAANLQILASQGITGYVSLKERFNRAGPDYFTQDDFIYDQNDDTVTCPAGCIAHSAHRDLVMTIYKRRFGTHYQFSVTQCKACELRPLCQMSSSQTHGRQICISSAYPYYQEMKARMESEEGKAAYRNRYKIEHKVADLARYCGMRRCRYRGLERAKIHALLSAVASNVKRMARLLCHSEGEVGQLTGFPPQKVAIAC